MRFGHDKTLSQRLLSKYNYSLRSNSTKYSLPRLGCPADMPVTFESKRKAKLFALLILRPIK